MAVTISIGSGKGGTGKTMIIVNLALLLARTGRKVCLIDLDLGGADAQVLFGLFQPKRSLGDFLTKKVDRLSEVAYTFSSYNNLQFIPGTGDTLQTANLSYQEKKRLLRALTAIEADVLLIDVGAGAGYHALDFFMFSDLQICVTLPDPASIMDLYNFLQLATIRKVLSSFLSQSKVGNVLKSSNFASLAEVFALAEETTAGARREAQLALRYFHPLLIVNRDGVGGRINLVKLRQLVERYLAIDIPELGKIPEDSKVDEALKAFMPVCDLFPASPATEALTAVATRIDKIIDLFNRNRISHNTSEWARNIPA
jgi:flagellar biosynthesis protein FlhG